jgi:hypothetical protein
MAIKTPTDNSHIEDTDVRNAIFFGIFRDVAFATIVNCLDEVGLNSLKIKLYEVGYSLDEILGDQYKFEDAIYKVIPFVVDMPAPLLLRVVLIRLCEKLGVQCDRVKRYDFTKYFHELHQGYIKKTL